MKIRLLLPALALVLLLAACAPAPAPDTSAADEAAIRSAIDNLLVSWNAGDTAALAPYFSDDIRWDQPEATVSGREAVLASIPGRFDVATHQQSATVDEVAVYGDHAHTLGTWTVAPRATAPAGSPTLNGRWLIVWKRGADGTWREWRWIHNMAPAPAS